MNLDEFGLIRHLASRVKDEAPYTEVGIGDDAAVLRLEPGESVVVTTDTMTAGVHFLPTTMSWVDVGYKLVASSVSDVAAMGGTARQVLISLAVPPDLPLEALEGLYDGIHEACRDHRCGLVGGDVVRTDGALVLTSTLLGAVPAGQAVRRSGAKVGDLVFATGYLGSSGAGLRYLLEGTSIIAPDEAHWLARAHQRPRAQIEGGVILREEGANSLNDISDGLASELNEIAAASGVRLRIDADRIPIAPAVRNFARQRREDPLQYAWYGGEDYQLVGTMQALQFARALARCESVGIHLTQIGRVVPGDGVVADYGDGRTEVIAAKGFNHFSEPHA